MLFSICPAAENEQIIKPDLCRNRLLLTGGKENVNLEYILPNKQKIQFLNDNEIYLGNQVESEFNDGEIIRCFGILANLDFILISEYGVNGENPELIIYKKR